MEIFECLNYIRTRRFTTRIKRLKRWQPIKLLRWTAALVARHRLVGRRVISIIIINHLLVIVVIIVNNLDKCVCIVRYNIDLLDSLLLLLLSNWMLVVHIVHLKSEWSILILFSIARNFEITAAVVLETTIMRWKLLLSCRILPLAVPYSIVLLDCVQLLYVLVSQLTESLGNFLLLLLFGVYLGMASVGALVIAILFGFVVLGLRSDCWEIVPLFDDGAGVGSTDQVWWSL